MIFFSGRVYADIGPGTNEAFAIFALYPLFLLVIPIAAKKGTRWFWLLSTIVGYPISTFFIFVLRADHQFYTTVAKSIAVWMLISCVLLALRLFNISRDLEKTTKN